MNVKMHTNGRMIWIIYSCTFAIVKRQHKVKMDYKLFNPYENNSTHNFILPFPNRIIDFALILAHLFPKQRVRGAQTASLHYTNVSFLISFLVLLPGHTSFSPYDGDVFV